MSNPTAPPPQAPPQPPKQRGCFFYGCITCVVLFLIFGIAGFLALRYGLNKVTAIVEAYTETSPATLPSVQMPAAEYAELDKRLTAFQESLNGQKAEAPLVLTGNEINVLIANNPAWKPVKGKLYVTIEGDQIKGKVSIPMDELARVPGLSKLHGRYLNGSTSLKAQLQGGKLVVNMQSLEAKGQSPPENIMAQLRMQNLAQNIENDSKSAEIIRRLESIEIKDGKITVKARANGSPSP